jgi:8-oxo-dGTP pyrophosphatase MutT (NUDIX family)
MVRNLADRLHPLAHSYLPAPEGQRLSAVLVPLLQESHQWKLLFTKRSEQLAEHGGQISFPGGQADPGDRDPAQTALREACEELGIPEPRVRLLGMLSRIDTTTGFIIQPIVGILDWPLDLVINRVEVDEVFSIPLEWLQSDGKPALRDVSKSRVPGRRAYYFAPYQGRVIWGATAAITMDLLNKITYD